MNRSIIPLIIIMICFILPNSIIEDNSEWSSAISRTHNWHISKYEFNYESDLVGGINAPGGDISINIRSELPKNFNFFNGSRLDLQVVVEGDNVLPRITQYGSDFHLLILPIKIGGISFFELLFNEKVLLENLTHSEYVSSIIIANKAATTLEYRETYKVEYEWDLSTGLLILKEVTNPEGLKFVVSPGEGWRANEAPNVNFAFVWVSFLSIAIIPTILNNFFRNKRYK